MIVLALVRLMLHKSMRLHVSQCFHCVKADSMHETRFKRKITRLSALNVVFAKKHS